MAVYTTTLRNMCEIFYSEAYPSSELEMHGFTDIDEVVKKTRHRVFNFSYPTVDPKTKVTFEEMFIKHYYLREIGLETFGLFQLRLQARLNEIMPYYNQLYESTLLKFDPLINTDYTTVGTVHDEGLSKDTTGSERSIVDKSDIWNDHNDETTTTYGKNIVHDYNDKNKTTYNSADSMTFGSSEKTSGVNTTDITNKHSDTPQGGISGLENGNYMSSADINQNKDTLNTTVGKTGTDRNDKSGSDTVDHTGTNSDHYTGDDTINNNGGYHTNTRSEKMDEFDEIKNGSNENLQSTDMNVSGKTGSSSYSQLLMEYRDTFLNIYQMILDDCEELFMGIW